MSEFNSKFIKYLCLLLFLKGCAYFNTFYNAEEHFETAERIRIENLGGQIPSRSIQEYGKAIEKSEKVLREYSDSRYVKDARLLKGKSHYFRREYDSSVSIFNQLIFEEGFEQEAKYWLALCKWKDLKPQPAINDLKILSEEVDSKEFKSKIFLSLGEIYLSIDDSINAYDNFDKGANLSNNRILREQVYFQIAEISFQKTDFDKALESYQKVLSNTVSITRIQDSNLKMVQIYRLRGELEKSAKAILFDGEVVKSQIRSAGYELNACKKADCEVAAIGDSLGMQYIITGSIEKNKERYGLSALLTDVVTGEEERIINTNYNGPVDGMITELEIMAWEIMDQNPPESLVEKRKGKTKKKIKRPNAKTSLGALARATLVPGWGHRYLGQKNKSYAFFGFETAALTFGYLFYNDYKSAYDDVDKYWSEYKKSTDHDLLQEYRAKTLEAEQVMIDNNNNLTLFFRMAGVIHVVNMLDAYMTEIAPQGIAEKTQIELGYDPIIQQPQLRFSIALD